MVAMLIVALAASVAAAMIHAQEVSLRRLESSRDLGQARWILRGAVQWARMILAQDARAGAVDHPAELWAGGLPATPVEDATLAGALLEAQGRFNLNSLVLDDGTRSEPDLAALKRLLAALGLRSELAEAIADWMDGDAQASSPGGAEDGEYLRRPSPYRAANQRIADVTELRRVRGCDEATLARLLPHVTALPARTPVNVNFAPAEVLMAVVEGLARAEALELVRARAARPFRDGEDFRSRLPRRDLKAPDDAIVVQSRFFFVAGRVRLRNVDARTHALLRRDGHAPAVVVWERGS